MLQDSGKDSMKWTGSHSHCHIGVTVKDRARVAGMHLYVGYSVHTRVSWLGFLKTKSPKGPSGPRVAVEPP